MLRRLYLLVRYIALAAFLTTLMVPLRAATATPLATHPPTAISTVLNREVMGMVIRDPWYDFGTNPNYPNQPNYAAQEQMGATLAELGVRWVRLEFLIEGSDATVAAQIARNDYFINEVAPRYNLKVLGLLSFGLIRDIDPLDPGRGLIATNTITIDPVYGGGVNDYMRTWLNRARLIADRYQGRVAAYEILNEHNRLPFSGAGVSAIVAGRLHTKFYRFFRNVDRAGAADQSWRDGVPVILGGLHPAGTHEPGDKDFVSDLDYLRQTYASDGFQSYRASFGRFPVDGIGYHPYPAEIRASLQDSLDLITSRLQQVRNVLANELSDPLVQFWITEVGYNAGYPRQNEAGQAAFLRAVFTNLAARGDVATIFWFKYEDFPPASGPDAQKWGVVRIPFVMNPVCPGGACYAIDGKPDFRRMSFWVYRELAGLPVYWRYMPIINH